MFTHNYLHLSPEELLRYTIRSAFERGLKAGRKGDELACDEIYREYLLSLPFRNIGVSNFRPAPLYDVGIGTVGEALSFHEQHFAGGGLLSIAGFGLASLMKLKSRFYLYGINFEIPKDAKF